jgi:hypothetical protein
LGQNGRRFGHIAGSAAVVAEAAKENRRRAGNFAAGAVWHGAGAFGNRVWRELEPQQRQQRIEFRNGKQCGGDDYIYVDIGRSYSYSDSGGFSSH